MNLIDTHCHLYLEQFNADIEDVIVEAGEVGLSKILLPNIDSSSLNAMNELETRFPSLMLKMIGLHPTSVNESVESELLIVESELKKGGYIAIGEVGIDLYWDKTFFAQQEKALRKQIEWALEYKLPLAIHNRDAFDEISNILKDYRDLGLDGVFHCFTGSYEQAKWLIDFGFHLGIGGVVTFKNSKLPEVIAQVGLQKLVLETDSPFLAPTPHRGKRNKPSYTLLVAQKIAETVGVPVDTVAQITSSNAIKLFKL